MAVLNGDIRRCTWATLKALYFKGSTDQVCMDKLVAWAGKNGINLELSSTTREAPGLGPRKVYEIHFSKRERS